MNNKKTMMEYLKEYWMLITSAVSGVYMVIKGGAYVYCQGAYSAWKVPVNYVEINNANSLFDFCAKLLLCVLIVSYLVFFSFQFYKESKTNSGLAKWIRLLLLFFVIPILPVVLLAFEMVINTPVLELGVEGMVKELNALVPYVIVMAIMCYFLTLELGIGFKEIFLRILQEQSSLEKGIIESAGSVKSQKPYKSHTTIYWKVFVTVFIFVLLFIVIGSILYSSGREDVQFSESVHIVSIEENKYVVVSQYKDSWIIKECIAENDQLVINQDHFMISDIHERDIKRYVIENGKTVGECMVSDQVFRKVLQEYE